MIYVVNIGNETIKFEDHESHTAWGFAEVAAKKGKEVSVRVVAEKDDKGE